MSQVEWRTDEEVDVGEHIGGLAQEEAQTQLQDVDGHLFNDLQ